MTGFVFLLLSCYNEKKASAIQAGKPVQMDSMPGNCPYLTKDKRGNIVMSWARSVNDSAFVFCYAVSSDGGKSFGKTITIPSSDNIQPHSENLPKIIFKPSGEIIALWGAANPNPINKYSGLVYYSQSFDEGKTWSPSKPLVNDTAGYDQRYYDVALLPSGEAAIIWLDNRKATDNEGSALYFAKTEGANGFQHEKMIGEGCCQCCRTDLFVDSKAGIHVLYRGIIKDSVRDMLHRVSTDGGKNFSGPRLISNDNWVIRGCPHTGPAMTENEEGLHFAWFTGGGNKGCFYTQSADNGKSFIQSERISAAGSHPQISSFSNGELLVAWDEPVQVNNKYFKRIAIQKRSAAGKSEQQSFITADTLTASYPVVASLNKANSVIAYIVKKDKKDYVVYQRVEL
ncbi:sialidase family protein [Terrimonas pollutisoli]|uniref:sialidase family protein n=1 Tax=Terrimonas pollutisoli TaxID=3034147 RepID=UPI0023EDF8E4|nr:sialidase family protein [Terrimonas sp. H1YJ31]